VKGKKKVKDNRLQLHSLISYRQYALNLLRFFSFFQNELPTNQKIQDVTDSGDHARYQWGRDPKNRYAGSGQAG